MLNFLCLSAGVPVYIPNGLVKNLLTVGGSGAAREPGDGCKILVLRDAVLVNPNLRNCSFGSTISMRCCITSSIAFVFGGNPPSAPLMCIHIGCTDYMTDR